MVAEREANELLAKGDQAAATAKFVEADRLSSARGRAAVPSSAGIELSRRRLTRRFDRSRRPNRARARPDRTGRPPAARPVAAAPAPARGRQPAAPAGAGSVPTAATAAAPAPMPEPAEPPSRPRIAERSLLGEAQALFKNGNYPAAKQLANEAKAGKFGVDAQADELIAQIALPSKAVP